jgi:deazaflavin-dependent oxidoreductase (nitroreductase family)
MAEANRKMMRFVWKSHKLIWKLSRGRLGRKIGGMPVLELVTTGHKSGLERQILITYIDDPGGPTIIGANAGREADPAWVKNLRANRRARARWDGTWHDITAAELLGDVHDDAWNAAVDASAAFADYQETLTRPIPIVRLQPR